MSYENVLTENRDGVLIITMHRPERLNAWTPQMGGELRAAIENANDDDDINAIVMTGAGRGFCAGADIEAVFKAQADGDADSGVGGDGGNQGPGDWITLVRQAKPIVAAVNGPAIGVGLTQILPMDYLVAAAGAKLSMRFVKMGITPELASSHYLFARVSFGQASELMLTGKTISADEALDIGLVDKVVAPEALLDSACEVARAMGENPQSALRHIKALISANAAETDMRAVQKRELQALHEAYKSPEHKEAIAAFLEKREPDFKAARQQA